MNHSPSRVCSEAGDLVVVGWALSSSGAGRLDLGTSIVAVHQGREPELAVVITVRDRLVGPLPIASVSVNGVPVTKGPLLSVPMRPGLGRVYRGSVMLPMNLVDGRDHEVLVSVTTRRSAEDETVRDLGAVSDLVLQQTLRFYAKRFARAS